MWTETTQGIYERKGARYATDLTDEQWTILEPLLAGRSTDIFFPFQKYRSSTAAGRGDCG